MFCLSNCVPMLPKLRGAQLLAMWVSWWIEGKAKM